MQKHRIAVIIPNCLSDSIFEGVSTSNAIRYHDFIIKDTRTLIPLGLRERADDSLYKLFPGKEVPSTVRKNLLLQLYRNALNRIDDSVCLIAQHFYEAKQLDNFEVLAVTAPSKKHFFNQLNEFVDHDNRFLYAFDYMDTLAAASKEKVPFIEYQSDSEAMRIVFSLIREYNRNN